MKKLNLKQNIKDSKINIKTLKFPKGKGWNFTESENKIIMNVNEEKYKDFFVKLINLILTKIFLENLIGEKSIKCFLEKLIFICSFRFLGIFFLFYLFFYLLLGYCK